MRLMAKMIPVFLLIAGTAAAQETLPVLRSTRPSVSVQEGETLRKDAWRLAPEVKPDVYEVALADGRPTKVTFITDVGSMSFDVEVGKYDFIIQYGEARCETRIVGIRSVPAATFDADYRALHKGKISVEVPEVYELVNVAIAMTPTGLGEGSLVYKKSAYYGAMRKWFDPYRDHPAIKALDAVLRQSPYIYSSLKMNGYAFEFDANGRIVPSRIFDRTGFNGEKSNLLRPYMNELQSFADDSKFRSFYKAQRATYEAQIAFYTRTAGIETMRAWLDRNFPGSAGYESYRVIFSPLVAYNQSATWFESNGFRELHAHVNYPYPEDVGRRTKGVKLSKKAETVLRSDIVFTELNHGYINPEADKYEERILKATANRGRWVDPSRGADYYGGISAFNEYMNWGLVSLRVVDFVPVREQQTLITIVDDMMTTRRGFPQFAEFDTFLVDLYRHRQSGATIADLYLQIIAWFEEHDADPREKGVSESPGS